MPAWLGTRQPATRDVHTFALMGTIAVPSGDTDFIPPFYIEPPQGCTPYLISLKHKINSGTSVTYKLQINGSDATGFTALSATTTEAVVNPTDVVLASGDRVAVVVTAVSGAPKNLTISLVIESK